MDLFIQTITSVSYAIVSPELVFVLLSLGILLYFKNRKIVFMQRLVMGEMLCSPLELTLSQLVLGIIGGLLASLLLNFLGVTFYENSGIEFVFILSILSFLYKPKYFNFPYLATMLGIISIAMEYLTKFNINIPMIHIEIISLIMIVGIISFIQGLLIIIDGQKGYIPIFTNRDEKILGGFAFKRYWTLPVSLLIIMGSLKSPEINNVIVTSNWWPLIDNKDILSLLGTTALIMMPLYGFVGYEAVTFTRKKREKTTLYGGLICLYGVIVCIIAQIIRVNKIFQVILLLLIPILYELIKYIDNKLEQSKAPLFISDNEGICILEVIPNSLAFKQGVRSGDKIIEVNGEKPLTETEVLKAIKENYYGTNLKIKNIKGEILEYKIEPGNREKRFGVVLVPKYSKERYTMEEMLQKVKKLKNKD
ncbi:PDZ domain-containing protein [Clostridium tarantellae]|uniref:PDZ domain-containing protein n=1 Tax=Clostridium tarantellae TaxID=39493 RepID=A0A6I1MM05_9CLOT|nr:PDZ domain-containing protein [Clostridium tarantellae]MPQ43147.1 PDZ domain-containing protein [Clostridium tarantellae]